MMVVANICYLLFGPGLESLVNPSKPETYRRLFFCLGAGFSVALPFVIPALVAFGG